MTFSLDTGVLKHVYHIIRDAAALLSPTFLVWDHFRKRPKVKCKVREAVLLWDNGHFRHQGDFTNFTVSDFVLKLQFENTGTVMTSVSDISLSLFNESGNPIAVHPAAVEGNLSPDPIYAIKAPAECLIAIEPNRVVREDIVFHTAVEAAIKVSRSSTAKLRMEFVNHKAIEMKVHYWTPREKIGPRVRSL